MANQLNDSKHAALVALGHGATDQQVNDMMLLWAKANGGTSDCLSDAIYEALVVQGATPGNVNDMWLQILTTLGITPGALNDMLTEFWVGGGVIGPTPPVVISAAFVSTTVIRVTFNKAITGNGLAGVTWTGLTDSTPDIGVFSDHFDYTITDGQLLYNDDSVTWDYVNPAGAGSIDAVDSGLELATVSRSIDMSALPDEPVAPVPDLYIPLISDLLPDTGTATTTVTRALNTGTDETAAGLISTINANLPRFYQGLGLLSEAAHEVIQRNDEVLNGNNGTITSDDITAPDGSVNGDLFTCDTSTNAHYLRNLSNVTISTTLGEEYISRAFIKPGTETVFQLTTGSGGFGADVYANFICTGSGSVGDTGAGATTSGCELRADGWYDCWMQHTATATIAAPGIYLCFTGNDSTLARFGSFAGASETGHFWGVSQYRDFDYKTSPIIATVTTGDTCNADVIQVDESLPNPLACNDVSWGLDYTPLHDSGETDWLWASESDTSNGVYLLYDGTNMICRKRLSGGNNDAVLVVNVVPGQTYTVLGRMDSVSGVSISVDGVAGTPHVNTTDAVIASTAYLGANGTGGGQTSCVISEYKRYD